MDLPPRPQPGIATDTAETHASACDVSILIVAFNSRDCIEQCIGATFRAAKNTRFEILLSDNGEDGTAAVVAELFPEVSIIPSAGNVGFACGINRLVQNANGRYLLLLNPDAFLDDGAIDALVQAASRYPTAGALGAVTYDHEGKPDFGNVIPVPSLKEYWSFAIGRVMSGRGIPLKIEEDAQVPVLSGSCMMIRRSVWEAMGGLDERFFLYSEELDLCVRMHEAGLELYRIAAARAEHRIAHGNFQSPLRRLYQAAGSTEFMRKHWSRPRRLIAAGLIWTGAMARFVIGGILGRSGSPMKETSWGHRLIALRPSLWLHGYHAERGLKARLDQGALKDTER